MDKLYENGLLTTQVYEETINRPGPEHIPPIILYLSTDEAANINGWVFGASKGRVARYAEPAEVRGLYKDGIWTLEDLVRCMPSTLAQDVIQARG